MKKFFLFAMAFAMTATASAQQLEKVQVAKAQAFQQKTVKMENRTFFEKGQAPAAKVAAGSTQPDTVYYAFPKNTFFQGYSPEGRAYKGSYIIASLEDSLIFENGSAQHNGLQYGWNINNTMVSTDDAYVYWTPNDPEIEADYLYRVPELVNENSDSYQFAANDEDSTYIWASPSDYVAMTSAYVDSVRAYGWSGNNDYYMGTGMILNSGDTVDTYVVFFGTSNATMSIDTISLMFWSHQANPLPSTNGLSMVLFDEESGNVIARHKATASDIAWIEPGTGIYYGQLSFPIKANITGEVSAYITGFNNPGVSIGCFVDDDNRMWQSYQYTYFVYQDKYLYTYGNNIALFFNAKFGAATAIENNAAAVKATKALVNGQLVITKGNRNYNILGAKL